MPGDERMILSKSSAAPLSTRKSWAAAKPAKSPKSFIKFADMDYKVLPCLDLLGEDIVDQRDKKGDLRPWHKEMNLK